MNEFFKTSQIINDTQTIFSKIASYIYFCNKINIELNIENLSNVKGLSEFITSYKPFNTDYLITSEGKTDIRDKKENKFKLNEFKKNIKNIIQSNIINYET